MNKTQKHIIAKVEEWIARGTEIEKIRKTASTNWGVNSEVKNGQLHLAMMTSIRDGRQGWGVGRNETFAIINL